MAHEELMRLMVGYTLVGALIFTVVVTCLSLVGLIKFADPDQQKKLFYTLIVELVVISLASFSNIVNLSPKKAAEEIQAPLESKVEKLKETVTEQAQQKQKLENSVLDGLQPHAADLATQLIAAARERGIELRIVSGYRSPQQQLDLYAQGREAPGPVITNARVGVHSTGLAFDVMIFEDGQMVTQQPLYTKIGDLGEDLGLVWGGRGRFPDYPHFETQDAQQALKTLSRNRDAGT